MANENSATSSLNQTFTNMNPNNLIATNAATQLPLKLTPTNYYSWKTQFDALLYGYDLLGYIDGTKPCPSPETTVDEKIVPNPDFTLWMRQDKLLLLGIIGSLSHKVVPVIRSCKTSAEAWNRLAKLYANPSSSRTMGLAEQLTLINRGSQPVADYLATIRDIANELALIGAPVPNQYLITHTLNGVGTEFKELAASVRARDTVISFDELHDKLVEYEAFLKREDLRSSGNLGNMTANAARFPTKNGNQANKKNFHNNNGNQGQHPPNSGNNQGHNFNNYNSGNHHSGKNSNVVCQFCEKRGHTARQCNSAKKLFSHSSGPTANPTTTNNSSPNWLLDTGASHHVTSNLNNLSLSQPYEGPDDIVIGDGTGSVHGSTSRSRAEQE